MSFNYDKIPQGYYDQIFNAGTPVRRLWHRLKFLRVISCLDPSPGQNILDIGCFAGSFLSLLSEAQFKHQIGIDMLPTQIAYANQQYGTPYRRFINGKVEDIVDSHSTSFDVITLIEVIEHLNHDEIRGLLNAAAALTKPGGRLIVSTPNYLSAWPLIEILINRFSDVSYEEQHITKFHYFNFAEKLGRIHPVFTNDFKLLNKTTTHFVAPFLAAFSEDLAMKTASHWSPESWNFPLGSMLLFAFERNKS